MVIRWKWCWALTAVGLYRSKGKIIMRESDHEIMSSGTPLDISSNFVARLFGLKSCWRNSDDTMLMFWWEDDGWVRIVWGRQWVRGLHLPCWICPDLSWQAVPPASLHALTTFPSYRFTLGWKHLANKLCCSQSTLGKHLASTHRQQNPDRNFNN